MREYDHWLTCIESVSNRKKIMLTEYFGSSKELYRASKKSIKSCPHLRPAEVEKIYEAKLINPQALYKNTTAMGIGFTCFYDDDYPLPLKYIDDPPYGIFYKGHLPKSFDCSVAIVGARMCSAYGRSAAEDIGAVLSKAGAIVISGMARGIDCAAHVGVVKNDGTTVAVLGCGVDICYPYGARNLYEKIQKKGCILSEYPPGTPPLPVFFPQRNRIISGLSRVVIVIEAAGRSGSLITADIALDQGKDIYALPGRITDRLSEGTNRLIAQGAGIIWSVEELIDEFRMRGYISAPQKSSSKNEGQKDHFILEKEEEVVYSCLDFYPVGLDELLQKSKLPVDKLSDALISLAKKDLVRREGFKSYSRNGIL